mgnify:CR=1 FL=1
MAAACELPVSDCFHCGLPVPPGFTLCARIDEREEPVCCVGCLAAAELIDAEGLGDWYARRREATGQRAESAAEARERLAWLDAPGVAASFVESLEDGGERAGLLVEGLVCAACVWVIERHLEGVASIRTVRVGLESRRVVVEWSSEETSLRDIVLRLAEIGFHARPDRPGEAARLAQQESRRSLIRLGVSGLATMNVMTYSVALYAGAFEGMADGYEALMRWMGLVVATPVVVYAAAPFFRGAVRDLRLRSPGMDVPVALAIGGAFAASVFATLRGTGEVYYDSVCMFTFFLQLGRHLEMGIRHRAASAVRGLEDARPTMARRLSAEGEELVPAEALVEGDQFRVRPGEAIAADGRVLEGRSAVEEAWLTGEPWARSVAIGGRVRAGGTNLESPLLVEAIRTGARTRLSSIARMVERAQSERPAIARLADRVAARFVGVVLAIAIATFLAWSWIAPDRALWTTLAVLVATCPCALGLATPAALGAATRALALRGLLITGPDVLEGLTRATRFIFDKTGTLTAGQPALTCVVLLGAESEASVLALARRLERDSEHPIARALAATQAGPGDGDGEGVEIEARSGFGVEGRFATRRLRIGRPEWVAERFPEGVPKLPDDADTGQTVWVLLGEAERPLAWLGLEDPLRPEARMALDALAGEGFSLEMLSGDPSPAAAGLARRLGLEVVCAAATPEQKLARVQALQRAGERVVVVGDGVNDGPLLHAADVSIAMGSGCDLSRLGAGAVLLDDRLDQIPLALAWARRTRRIVLQNFAWAIAYNLTVLPIAVSGHLAPWLAAIGMSASSLAVVLNAMRLRRLPEADRPAGEDASAAPGVEAPRASWVAS